MAYKNITTGQKGTLFKLLPNTSNANLLSEDELNVLDIYFINSDTTIVKPWQKLDSIENIYDEVNDKVNEVKNISYIPLDEFKTIKYTQIKTEGTKFILNEWSIEQQTSALAGFYTPEECAEILSFTKTHFDIIRLAGDSIINATTYEEVNLVYFKLEETDEITMEVLSTKFWGEL